MHKRHNSGFTIIEVSLFLALSGFLMVGLIATANSSISRQRYNDSVNDVAEYFRGVYSEVLNVSMNPDTEHAEKNLGRDQYCAVYGKMIVLYPDWNVPGVDDSRAFSVIKTYTVLGNIYHSSDELSGSSIKEVFIEDLALHVRRVNGKKEIHEESTHNLPWQTSLENPDNTPIRKAIIILRSPTNGSVYTFVYGGDKNPIEGTNFQDIALENATNEDVDICIDSPDNVYGRRRNLRIHANASGSSGVDLIAQDFADNECGNGNSGTAPENYHYD